MELKFIFLNVSSDKINNLKTDSQLKDFAFFKCFTVIFSLKKKQIIQFSFTSTLFSTKKCLNIVNISLVDKKLWLSLRRLKQEE